jgi:predicted metal-dependent hydrolase
MTAGNIHTGIKVRRPSFRFGKNFKKYYARDNVFMTHFVNTLHILFPEGEKFFIRSIMHFKDQFKDDEALNAAVKDFIGQEGVHQKLHRDFWKVMEVRTLMPKDSGSFIMPLPGVFWKSGSTEWPGMTMQPCSL